MNHYLTKKIVYEDIEITDIFRKFTFIDKYKNDIKYYVEYSIMDGETPEIVSWKFFNSTQWWWVLLLYNEIYDPFYDWPMTQLDLENYAKKLVPNWNVDPVSYMDKLNELIVLNETYRSIKIPKEKVMQDITLEIKNFYK